MKIGYPCINRRIGCTANSTFRLKNYSETRLIEIVTNNLACLTKILQFNLDHQLLFFRISSALIPFASHPVCQFDWASYFGSDLKTIGQFIKQHAIRISMHPDQFVLINAQRKEIVANSVLELLWHCQLLDAMELDLTAKVQIHVGGSYGDKTTAIKNFINNYNNLPDIIKQRLVIENDDRIFNLADCLIIHEAVGIPIIFDNLHHQCNNQTETLQSALASAIKTWQPKDGAAMTDYSTQEPGARIGKHTETIDTDHFTDYLQATRDFDFDIMLEIKDKENSALKAINIANSIS